MGMMNVPRLTPRCHLATAPEQGGRLSMSHTNDHIHRKTDFDLGLQPALRISTLWGEMSAKPTEASCFGKRHGQLA